MTNNLKLNKLYSAFKIIKKKFSPSQIIVVSVLLIIILGGFILSLPISHAKGQDISIIDAYFTAVSAVCVTGLSTLTIAAAFNLFGKLIILCLIQIGGLSLITIFSFFLVNIGKKIGLKNRLAIQAALNTTSFGGMVKLVVFVVKGTFLCEGLGAVFLFFSFLAQKIEWHKALLYGVFHSVSAFCNAGFDIIGDESLILYSEDFFININLMLLIIFGGLGFTVWQDLIYNIKKRFISKSKQKLRLSLHSKLALLMTGFLLVFGCILIFALEYNNPKTIGGFSLAHKILASAFQSVSLRTAGFATIPQSGLTDASKLISSILMLIGGSPGGTAGGIKTVTLAIVFFSVWSIIKGRNKIIAFGRTLSQALLQKALAIIVLMLTALFLAVFLLLITEDIPFDILDIIFEVCSALGTVGFSAGLTPLLSFAGKLIMMTCMFIGRIGPIALIISIYHGFSVSENVLGYPEEDVMIG